MNMGESETPSDEKKGENQYRTHADPAEVVLAQPAGHVVAPLVLLDARIARRALARVGEDPVGGFRLVDALERPLGELRAGAGIVSLLA
jgi:hypothetical protein